MHDGFEVYISLNKYNHDIYTHFCVSSLNMNYVVYTMDFYGRMEDKRSENRFIEINKRLIH